MNKFALTATLALGLAAASSGYGQAPGAPSFDELDSDSNGSLTREEINELVGRMGARGPGGPGGQAGGPGIPPIPRGPGGPGGGPRGPGGAAGGPPGGMNPDIILRRLDADGDGSVSREEFDARPLRGPRGPRGPGGAAGQQPRRQPGQQPDEQPPAQ